MGGCLARGLSYELGGYPMVMVFWNRGGGGGGLGEWANPEKGMGWGQSLRGGAGDGG